jgi:hypothetical protein
MSALPPKADIDQTIADVRFEIATVLAVQSIT